jgi:hypothetical protein
MTHRARRSNYPIGQLLIQLVDDHGGPLPAFFELLGYRNTQKAIKRFDQWLCNGCGEHHIIDSFRRWRPEIEGDLQSALERSEEILSVERTVAAEHQREEERAAFKPYIEAIPEESTPRSISLFALTGGTSRQRAALPIDILERSEEERRQLVGDVIRAHMQHSKGVTLWQGKILFYQVFYQFEARPFTFTTAGVLVGEDVDRSPGEATLFLRGGRPFPGTFF